MQSVELFFFYRVLCCWILVFLLTCKLFSILTRLGELKFEINVEVQRCDYLCVVGCMRGTLFLRLQKSRTWSQTKLYVDVMDALMLLSHATIRRPAIARIADRTGCQWHSWSSKVNDFHLVWQGVCHFLLVTYNLIAICVSLHV